MNVYERQKPFQSNEERLVSESLAATQVPADILERIRPPLPQVELMRPRYGYPNVQERALGVNDVLGVHQTYPDARNQISGGREDIQGSSRNVTGQANIGF